MNVPPTVPGYELFQRLGGGALTSVFEARDCETDLPCAVKLLRDDADEWDVGIKLLQREARIGLTVRHPHLVRIEYAHVTREPYFLVMELIRGESVRGRLRREFRLDLPTTLWIARQTAEALQALHRRGFVHGDVKPDNVRLVDDGTAILVDLGFAHRVGENAALREQGYILGTANYLAPELCNQEPDADQRSDLFSLGVMLFEMLTGQLPYPPGSVNQVLRRHSADPPADVERLAGPLPAPLVRLVGRLLDRNPERRPRAPVVVQQLMNLEISAFSRRRTA